MSLLVVCIFGCDRSSKHDAGPPGFADLAQKFKAKAGGDRRAEGVKIQAILPRCQKTWEQDIGTGILMSFDYKHPSYKLAKQELIQALGQPDIFGYDTVRYVLFRNTNNLPCLIEVDLRDDYVVGATITGSLK